MKLKIAMDLASRWDSSAGNGPEPVQLSNGEERQLALLTRRENDVIRCFSNGLLYKETADALNISYSAVHKHQHKAFLKLRVSNRSEAIRKWWELGGR